MTNSVTTSHRYTSTNIVHGKTDSKLTLTTSFDIIGIGFASQQIRRNETQAFLSLGI